MKHRNLLLLAPFLILLTAACGTTENRPAGDLSLAETATRAGFWIGAAVPGDVDDPRMNAVPTHFNSITAERTMKWGELAQEVGVYDFSEADGLVDFAAQKGLRLRGHTLVWGKFPGSGHPANLSELMDGATDPESLMRAILTEHITTVMSRYAGRVESWDVVNEPMNFASAGLEPNLFLRSMGPEYIAEAFRAAHEADPEARLFLNEFFLDYAGAKSDDFLNLLSDLVAAGVPIDGVGIQAHVQISVPDEADFRLFLQAIADLGLAVELTEVDVAKTALQTRLAQGEDLWELQAEVYDALASSCVAVETCQGITTWGIDDGQTWLDDEEYSPFWQLAPHEPLLLDADLNKKPAYFAVQERLAQRIP